MARKGCAASLLSQAALMLWASQSTGLWTPDALQISAGQHSSRQEAVLKQSLRKKGSALRQAVLPQAHQQQLCWRPGLLSRSTLR